MTENKTGNNKFLKEFNQKTILNLIWSNKALSRADLSQLTGLSPTAIGQIVTNLLEKGYIHETKTGESTGGRRPVMLELKPGSFFSIGVDMDVNYINFVLMDITGRIIYEDTLNTPSAPEQLSFQDVAILIEKNVQKIVNGHSIPIEKLLGVGISIPGIIDGESGKVILAPNMGWKNIGAGDAFKKLLQVPVYIENESMASAICENWLGGCQEIDNFVCINIRSGIGAGIFTGGKPYKGASGSAGEIGHIVVDENGPKCGCGNYGCLETLASTTRIVEQAKKLVRQGAADFGNINIEDIRFDTVVEAARNGDEAVKGVLLESARYIGIAISNIVNTLNPSKIVIGKEFVKYADLVLEHVVDVAYRKALSLSASNVEIVKSEIGEKASTLGAALIPLQVLYGR